jgi:hypothetical protein
MAVSKRRFVIQQHDASSLHMEAALKDGLLEVWLEGRRLCGGYALKRIEGGKKPKWLVIKMDDKEADARRNPVSTEPKSVLTGRTLAQVAAEEAPDNA